MQALEGMQTKRQLEELLEREWLSAKDASKLLDRTPQMVWTLGRQGRLGVLRTPGGILYSRADVERVLQARDGVRR